MEKKGRKDNEKTWSKSKGKERERKKKISIEIREKNR